MIDAKDIITVGPPQTPIHDVRITNVVNAAQGGYQLRYRPVAAVMYVMEEQRYPREDTVVVGKKYSFEDRDILGLDFYYPAKDHGNTKQGRCECGYSTCGHLGLWKGTKNEIVGNAYFREILGKRLEYLVKVKNRAVIAKEKRLAKIAADPAGHAEKLKEAKEKRDAKKAAQANVYPGQWPNRVPPGPFDGSRASLGLKGDEDNAVHPTNEEIA
jgi:hypothetical protein